jgi:PAS domain S-box-containing protein
MSAPDTIISLLPRSLRPGPGVLNLAAKVHGYTPALLALAAGMALTYLSNAILGPGFVALFFVWLMVLLIGAWCGYGPGILTVLVVALGIPFLFKPNFSLREVNPSGVVILLLVSAIVSRTAHSRRRAEALLRSMNTELDRRVREKTAALEDANQALQHRLAEVEALYSQLSVGLCFLDNDLRFVRINQELAAVNNLPAAAHIGRHIAEILPQPLARILVPVYRRVLDTGRNILNYELQSSHPVRPGDQRDWSISCSPVCAADGSVLGVQVVVQDITERKRSEQLLINTNTELRRANSDLEQFAYSASHDLQEPLRMVAIYSQMLRKRFGGQLGKDGDEFIEYTVQGARRMEQLVRDLLAYTGIAAGSGQQPPLTDAKEAFRGAVTSLGAAIAETGGTVEAGTLPQVRIHRVHLEQLLQNLISNGLKYRREEPPRIHVGAEQSGPEWVFSVSDNGIGIAPEYLQQIFGLFKRLHSAAEYAGTGIGLAICQRIVERHGGRIWAESREGEGSTFFFTLPVAPAAGVSEDEVPTFAEGS